MAEVLSAGIDVAAIRARFSSLRQGFAFLDAPGGTQVPDEVGDAIARALREASANLGAGYATSVRVGQILDEAEAKAARFLGCEPREVTFGPNMTTLNFALSRTAARAFRPGDEILVSCLDHDAGVAPWLEIAHDRDLVVRQVALHDDTTLDFGDLEDKLGPRTKVVAFAWASNAVGTVTDARRVCQLAHDAGALAWVDAVHYAAHDPIDVREHRCRRADLLAVQVLRPASRRRLRAGRGDRAVAAVQGPPGADQPAGAQLRDRYAAVRAARGVQRDHRLPGLDRRLRRDRALRALAGPAVPRRPARCGHRVRAARDGRPRADLPGQRRGRARRGRGRPPGRRADRGLGPRFLVLARPVPAPRLPRQVDPDRLHPLQHPGRGRPAAQRPGRRKAAVIRPPRRGSRRACSG